MLETPFTAEVGDTGVQWQSGIAQMEEAGAPTIRPEGRDMYRTPTRH